jgi:hypothetical protein
MTRQELKQFVTDKLIQFDYQCKVNRKKSLLRYTYRKDEASWFLLIVDYSENSVSLSRHYWPNERIETQFTNIYVHNLNEKDLYGMIKPFIK